MRFLVITDAPTLKKEESYSAYAPYVTEMNTWFKYVNYPVIISPTKYKNPLLLSEFEKQPKVISISTLNFTSIYNSFSSILKIPSIGFLLFKEMRKADHIHLRCPGNIALLGCFVQILFPNKIKTTKYAGNWDPKAKQPLSYKFQKWILSNTFITKNMQVLVYGDWKNQTKNIKSFFTATYHDSEKEVLEMRNYTNKLHFVFIGSLVEGKRPLLAIKTIEALHKKQKDVVLDIYGDGVLKASLINYIKKNNLQRIITLHGNQDKKVLKEALKNAHFLLLLSKSEGWPKVIAEAMFFGVIPISTAISCVPNMLNYGKRGILVYPELDRAVESITLHLDDSILLNTMSEAAYKWSQHYTLNVFEKEIAKLISH
jgi:glycosyltransferase involved in cell wall biosynthesis